MQPHFQVFRNALACAKADWHTGLNSLLIRAFFAPFRRAFTPNRQLAFPEFLETCLGLISTIGLTDTLCSPCLTVPINAGPA